MLRTPCFALLIVLAAVSTASMARGQSATALQQARARMVAEEIIAGGVKNQRVIDAMANTPRHEFVSIKDRSKAYFDMALPIGAGQTISGPFVVAYMTEQLDPQPTDRVLEIGTGSGYQAAVLSPLVKDIYSIEIVESLGKKAQRTLARLGYKNVHVKVGDGYQGWAEHAPYDKIIVTCSPEKVPQPLVDQLREGGSIIVPVGERYQQVLYRYRKENGKLVAEPLRPTLFVPMTGAAEDSRLVKPTPEAPALTNGSFEELTGSEKEPVGWYYSRLMKSEEDRAPVGKRYVTFNNDTPGRNARTIQGLGINGRKVRRIEITALVRGKELRHGPTDDQSPQISVTFFDQNRAPAGRVWVGPWQGTFDWRRERAVLDVPPQAREMIIHVGLLGGTGELSVDDVTLRPLSN